MDEYLGRHIDGRYEITQIIGVGGMANVYKARDLKEDRVVAVKIMHDSHMSNEDMRRRFKNESKAMAVLDHPGIRKIYDVYFTERIYCIVMEFVDGITLKEYLEQAGMLDWKETLHFVEQILGALRHAHEKGIVHRDIKPENIMLLQDGTLKLTDFGIARFARSEMRTLTETAIGSVHYISPEQASGAPTDARTDLYSLGALMYHMITGKLPFEANTPISVALKQIESVPTPPRELNASIPEGLEEIILHAMEKDLDRRYQSAAAMLRDIEEFKKDPSISFAYRYLAEDAGGKYADAIQTVNTRKKRREEKKTAKKRAPGLFIFGGITLAFVVATAVFVVTMFGRQLGLYAHVKTPMLLGQLYEEVAASPDYEGYQIVRKELVGSQTYGPGEIVEQSPAAGEPLGQDKVIEVSVARDPSETQLPSFRGQSVEEALKWLGRQAALSREELIYDDNIPAGCVVKTSPGAGESLPPQGQAVVIYVSQGPKGKPVELPDFTGINRADVERMLGYYGLKLGNVKYDPDYEDETYFGLVVGQFPLPGEIVEPATEVNITVAGQGNEIITLQIMAPLPREIGGFVRMSAVMNGKEVAFANAIPAQLKTWRPDFYALRGTQTEVDIFLDGKLYQVYALDFGARTVTRLYDYSEDFS